ncbi:MAG: hypothetical protein PHI18_10205 [bacterium]|nr:hypothetical protein [bacterium]
MQFATLALLALIAGATACRNTESGENAFRELEFRVDSTRLGNPISRGGLVFCPPAGWEEADSAVMSAVRERLSDQTADDLLGELDLIYIHPTNGAVLIVTTLDTGTGGVGDFARWARRFVERYHAASPEVPVDEDWLRIGGVPAVQMYRADSARVLFKYLLLGDDLIGLDYSVPRTAWADELRAVESSVGTVRKVESGKLKSES